ncbi:alanyl-tRNA editing protein [Fusobacterium perfoetens]|uniref:alanyl-tRNA editing protein n=1 Tax=Fusobacterium perfoetens TaxID=852 RepID=UPI001F41EEB1|nr:alanyl-tRNA editing protein [Fusobacterium perfoetens]MCF2624755.1 alanyl-tRNA editing protein [Fusobacterium perfoetens]
MLIGIKNCEKYKDNYAVEVEYIDLFSTKIYPDGKGGQLGDRGHINNIPILEAKEDKIIIAEKIEKGEYEYYIDTNRRKDIAMQHTAEHLFSGIALKDYNLHNVGFRMGEEVSTIDLDSDSISEETVKELSDKVNEAILKGAKVLGTTIMRYEADTISGLRKKISPKITDEYIRLIKIEDYDLCACAGFHVNDIKDIRVFKILSHERIKGKYTRFTFIAGDRAIKDYENKSEIIKSLNHKFSCRDNEIIEKIENFKKEHEDLKKSYNLLLHNYALSLKEDILKNAIEINSHKVVVFHGEKELVNELKKVLAEDKLTFIGLYEDSALIAGEDINCSLLIKEILNADSSVKGGGGAKQGNIKGITDENIIIESFKKIV